LRLISSNFLFTLSYSIQDVANYKWLKPLLETCSLFYKIQRKTKLNILPVLSHFLKLHR
jgi:hypothetical protein